VAAGFFAFDDNGGGTELLRRYASLAEDTIGTMGMLCSRPQVNISRENPAPDKMRLIFSASAALTSSANWLPRTAR
jgi:hypothetical protein